MHIGVLTTFVGIALLTPFLVKRPSTFIEMHTVLFVARVRLIVRVPAPLCILITIVLALHRAETARLGPIDISAGRRIRSNSFRIVRTVDTAQVETGRVQSIALQSNCDTSQLSLP